jgi:hypothetical protein
MCVGAGTHWVDHELGRADHGSTHPRWSAEGRQRGCSYHADLPNHSGTPCPAGHLDSPQQVQHCGSLGRFVQADKHVIEDLNVCQSVFVIKPGLGCVLHSQLGSLVKGSLKDYKPHPLRTVYRVRDIRLGQKAQDLLCGKS